MLMLEMEWKLKPAMYMEKVPHYSCSLSLEAFLRASFRMDWPCAGGQEPTRRVGRGWSVRIDCDSEVNFGQTLIDGLILQ